MGRPLYTSVMAAKIIVPEPEPQPAHLHYEKWSRHNAFDPDSDDFFDAPDAVYEAFLTDDQIAARVLEQQRDTARLLTAHMRDSEIESSSTGSSVDGESERLVMNDPPSSAALSGSQMEVDVQTEDGATLTLPVAQPVLRRQPRRADAMDNWPASSAVASEHEAVVPQISVVADETPVTPGRPSAPVSGLRYLTESPRALVPLDPPRTISPIPNTPARISGVFSPVVPPSMSPAPNTTPRILSWANTSSSSWEDASPLRHDYLGGRSLPRSATLSS